MVFWADGSCSGMFSDGRDLSLSVEALSLNRSIVSQDRLRAVRLPGCILLILVVAQRHWSGLKGVSTDLVLMGGDGNWLAGVDSLPELGWIYFEALWLIQSGVFKRWDRNHRGRSGSWDGRNPPSVCNVNAFTFLNWY